MRDQFTRISIFKQGNKKSLMDLLADYEESPLSAKDGLDYIYACYRDAIEREDGHGCLTINVLTSFGQGRLEVGIGSNQFYDKGVTAGKQEEQKRPQKAKPKQRKMESDSEDELEDESSDTM